MGSSHRNLHRSHHRRSNGELVFPPRIDAPGAARVFRQLMEDAQNFRHAFMDRYRFDRALASYAPKLNQLQETIALTANATDDKGRSIHAQAAALFQSLDNMRQHDQERFTEAFREGRALEAALNADVLALGLLFDKRSEQCGRIVRDLIAMPEVFNRDQLPKFEDCQNRLNDLIEQIGQSMKPLYHSLRENDVYSGV